ncbi:MAG: protein-(glutamine-N5) methyltransferase, release factor-specific [Rhodobacterales bacterium]|nr:MAG: protein-(glutamine-N5) methyltransferase, release factor-specific [Rhodobacterales bacterium]
MSGTDWARDALRLAAGLEPREVRRLLELALGQKLHRAEAADFTDAARARFENLIGRRRAHEPMSHLLGYRDFWKHRFKVGPQVLDPRAETELLIELALEGGRPGRFADLGTGSGAIAISLAAEWPGARGVATDISDAALEIAQENAAATGVALEFRQGSWCAPLDGRFDLIVSNPPYIAATEMTGLAPELNFEPRGALTDGADGLIAYRAIAACAPAHLSPGGCLLLEIGVTQGAAVQQILHNAGFAQVRCHTDLAGRDRVIAAKRA